MTNLGANSDIREIRSRAEALHNIRLTPANSRALRAELWALLADQLISDYLHGWNGAGPRELVEAEDAAAKALALDPDSALAHYARGFIERAIGRHRQALGAFDRAIRADPSMACAYAQKANELINLGRPKAAPALAEQAIKISPRDAAIGSFYWVRGRASFYAQDYAGAIGWLDKSVAARPDDWYNRAFLIAAYALTGATAQAARALADLDAHLGKYSIARIAMKEQVNPNTNRVIVRGREQLHQGLEKAGMPLT